VSINSRNGVRLSVLVSVLALFSAFPATATPNEGKRAPAPSPTSEHELDTPTKGDQAVRFALEAVGVPYRWGGESPSSGFDCSGLVRWAYGRVGIDLPHSSYALNGEGRRVSESGMQPGDILFFEGFGHVGLYLGRGRMVHAPQTGRNVEVVRLASTNYGSRLIAARRVVAA
jgi:cell wall-associated NlpC family hydrolase